MLKRNSTKIFASTAIMLLLVPAYALASDSTATARTQTSISQSARPDQAGTTRVEINTGARGLEQSKAARLAASVRLSAALELHTDRNEKATARVEAVIAKLAAEAVAKGEAATEDEALADIEAAVEAVVESVVTASAEELDILAEVKIQRGKSEEAKNVLRGRLAASPNSKAAYEKLISLEVEAGENEDLDTFVAGKKVQFDVRPMIKADRTLMPIRALVESLGAQIDWNAETRTVTILKGESTIVLQIGSDVALVNGEAVALEVAAVIEAGRTMIPARFVSEGLGLQVSWLAKQRAILVTEEPVIEDGE